MRIMPDIFRKKHHMSQPPHDKDRPRRRWLLLAAAFLALFFAAMPPVPAEAQQSVTVTADPATLPTLTGISSILSGLLSWFQIAYTWLMQHGFSSVSAAVNGAGALQASVATNNTTALMQSNWQGIWNGQVAGYHAAGTPASQSIACPVGQAIAAVQAQVNASDGAMRSLYALAGGEGNGSVTPVKRGNEILSQLCKLGMLSTDSKSLFGTYAQALGCTSDPNFANAAFSNYFNPKSLQDPGPKGMLVPSNVQQLPDNMLDFSNISKNGNGDCSTDERCFAAAVLHCELVRVYQQLNEHESTTNTFGTGGSPTPQISAAMLVEAAKRSYTSDPYTQCMGNIGRRAICSSSSSGSAITAVGGGGSGGSGSGSCAQLQQALCKALGTQPAAGADKGNGGNGGGMGIMDSRVQNCMGGSRGLSDVEAADAVFGRYGDPNSMNVAAGTMAADDLQTLALQNLENHIRLFVAGSGGDSSSIGHSYISPTE